MDLNLKGRVVIVTGANRGIGRAIAQTVTEEGATAVILASSATTGVMPTPVPMTVDRPFVVAIVDVPTNALLFLGHIGDPTTGM